MKRKFNPLITVRSAASGLLAAVVAITVTSCAFESGEPNPVTSKELAIDFATDLPTRATPTVAADMTKIGVFGYAHPAAGWAATLASAPTTLKPDYFANKSVVKSGTAWSYAGPPRYWPDAARRVSFFAYSPFSNIDPAIVLSPTSATVSGIPKLAFTVAADVTKQVDLLWDNSQIDKNNRITPITEVKFNMMHALTSVVFKVKLDPDDKGMPRLVTIDEVSVTNIVGNGTLDLTKGKVDAALWGPVVRTASNLTSYHLTAANGGLLATPLDARNESGAAFTANYINTANGVMMLIPQKFGDGTDALATSQLLLKYSVTNTLTGAVTAESKVFELSSFATKTMNPGDLILYNMTISLSKGVIIKVEVGAFDGNGSIDWGDGGTAEQPIS